MESKINKAVYGVNYDSIFGLRIISGIVTGVSYTEDKSPTYEITFGKNRVWVQKIAESKDQLFELLNLASLDRVKESHQVKIKYS